MASPRLHGKTALVTGGGAGIGAAIARRFVLEGARVLIGDRDQPWATALRAALDIAAMFQVLEVCDPGSFASVTNACWDLWAKSRGVPLWRLLLDLTSERALATLDLSYLEDELTPQQALALLRERLPSRRAREAILAEGYPGYDTPVGWFNYPDQQVRENCRRAIANGFSALKLKVGSSDPEQDLSRADLVREKGGDGIQPKFDANQQWTLAQALEICPRLGALRPLWIAEPTRPDDILGHKPLAEAIAPTRLALGERVANRVLFKNYLLTGCAAFIQVDALGVAWVSEFIAVSLLCRKFGVPVVPHVGGMSQIHQHFVLFNHVAVGYRVVFLERIPHLRAHFARPAEMRDGGYQTPEDPGTSCDLKTTHS